VALSDATEALAALDRLVPARIAVMPDRRSVFNWLAEVGTSGDTADGTVAAGGKRNPSGRNFTAGV